MSPKTDKILIDSTDRQNRLLLAISKIKINKSINEVNEAHGNKTTHHQKTYLSKPKVQITC